MRIAICGSACQGKTTLVNDFIKQWPKYKRSEESYRKVIKKENLKLNKEVDQDGQWKILNCLIDDIQKTEKGDNVIFDRCPLDNLVYSLWSEEKQSSDIDKKFIEKCIPLVQESMRAIDIIFFIPITRAAPVKIELKNTREIDEEYIKEIDNIFKVISHTMAATGVCPFMTKDDRPPIIEIFGNPEQRVEMIKLYINEEGDLIDNDSSILDADNLKTMEKLLKTQKDILYDEKLEGQVTDRIIRGHK
jgi:hypothetical protein